MTTRMDYIKKRFGAVVQPIPPALKSSTAVGGSGGAQFQNYLMSSPYVTGGKTKKTGYNRSMSNKI